ncbi:transcription elongation factor Elf1 like-domain-containing protein [Lipomyces arxii]|uniref:transcription elongation factor Elf1 like-domain-containing protein n=1 Tax=Lipomyces arxii TaxID=56418 RepID=UPI0034CE1C4D
MGKRKKSTRKPQKAAKREPLPTVFPCLFCNHENSVTCRIDKKDRLGTLHCKSCDESFQTKTTPLSLPVDVYSEWIDECENDNAVEKHNAARVEIYDASDPDDDKDDAMDDELDLS